MCETSLPPYCLIRTAYYLDRFHLLDTTIGERPTGTSSTPRKVLVLLPGSKLPVLLWQDTTCAGGLAAVVAIVIAIHNLAGYLAPCSDPGWLVLYTERVGETCWIVLWEIEAHQDPLAAPDEVSQDFLEFGCRLIAGGWVFQLRNGYPTVATHREAVPNAIRASSRAAAGAPIDHQESIKVGHTQTENIDPELLRMPIVEITPLHLTRKWNRLLERGGHHRRTKQPRPLSAKTVRNTAGVVSSAVARAIRWRLIPTNPVTNSEPPRVKKHYGIALTPVQQVMVFEAASGPRCMPVYLEVCAGTGARRGEVLALRWADIQDGRATFARSLT